VTFTEVLLRKDGADNIEVGQPFLNAVVHGEVIKQDRDEKITVLKFKRRKKYRVKSGHRQDITIVRITAI
jgi:large subunit ribosomal protein L21